MITISQLRPARGGRAPRRGHTAGGRPPRIRALRLVPSRRGDHEPGAASERGGGGTTLNGAGVGLRASSGTTTLVSDTVITSTEDGGVAVLAPGGPGGPLELRNVTAVAGGSSSTALGALSAGGAGQTGAVIDARNVIARGTANGAFGDPGAPSACAGPCAPGEVTHGYADVKDPAGVIDTTTIGHNQTADPLLVNPAVGPRQNFHIASADSPAIGAGAPDPGNGPTDRDGVPHPDPPSIGAYEFVGSPAAPGGGTGQPGTAGGNAGAAGGNAATPGGNAGGTGVAATRPTISGLTETNRVFVIGSVSTRASGRTSAARSKRGTTFLFRLDQPATVTVVITTSAKCRRRTAGAPRILHCSRMIARLTRSAHTGLNKLPFSGRIRGRPLNPGEYRAVLAAVSAGGSSDPKTLRFRIVRR